MAVETHRLLIGGEWRPAASGETFPDMNPATGEVFAYAARGGREDTQAAIEAAHAAFEGWANAATAVRELALLRAADLLETELPRFRDVMVAEAGCTISKAIDEIQRTVGMIRAAAGDSRRVMGETLPADAGKLSFTLRRPLGVVSVISPWNFPLYLAAKKVTLALAVGNTVVFKPASDTPITGVLFADLLVRAGVPAGAINLITGPGSIVGDELTIHPLVRLVSVTGETSTGRQVAQKAAGLFKKAALELGGNNPLLVLADADLEHAVSAALFGRFQNCGQNCMSAERLIVEAPLYERFCIRLAERAAELVVGDPTLPETQIGPLVNQGQFDWAAAHVADALAKGARLLTGGHGAGLTYHPTILADVTPEMRVFHEETFGPVAPVIRAENIDHAIALANAVNMGLSSGVMTGDVGKGLYVAQRIETGLCHINDSPVYSEPHIPFGGVKESGFSREGAGYSIDDLTELKWITIQQGPKRFPFG